MKILPSTRASELWFAPHWSCLFLSFFFLRPSDFGLSRWSRRSCPEKLWLARLQNDDLTHLAISAIKVARECFNDNGNQDAHTKFNGCPSWSWEFPCHGQQLLTVVIPPSFSLHFLLILRVFISFTPYFSASTMAWCPYVIICSYLSGNLVHGYAIWRLARFADLYFYNLYDLWWQNTNFISSICNINSRGLAHSESFCPFSSPETHEFTSLTCPISDTVHQGFGHSLVLGLGIRGT